MMFNLAEQLKLVCIDAFYSGCPNLKPEATTPGKPCMGAPHVMNTMLLTRDRYIAPPKALSQNN